MTPSPSSLLRLPDIIPPSFLETPSDSAANAAAKDSSERDDGAAAAVSSSPTAASRGTSAAAAAKRKSSASVAMPAPSALQIARRVQRKPFELRAKPLAADEAGRLIQGAFRRLLDVEGQVGAGGCWILSFVFVCWWVGGDLFTVCLSVLFATRSS